jgi:limonene-1,2-epoxide hydrolase
MLAAMAAAALIVAALVAVLVASGGDEPGSGGSAGSGQAEAPQEDGSAADGGVTSEAAGDPARAVRDFYEAAAEGDLEAATAVASPALEAQLGGPEGVASTFSTLETISFERIGTSTETAGRAEVEFETTAEHTDRTERCSGRATLLRDGGDWLVDRLAGVSCEVVD